MYDQQSQKLGLLDKGHERIYIKSLTRWEDICFSEGFGI